MQLHPPSNSSAFENRFFRAVLLALLASSVLLALGVVDSFDAGTASLVTRSSCRETPT